MGGGRETGREKERGRNANGSWQSSDDETHETHYLFDEASNRSLLLTRKHTHTHVHARACALSCSCSSSPFPSLLLARSFSLTLPSSLPHSRARSLSLASPFFLCLSLSLFCALTLMHALFRACLSISPTPSLNFSLFAPLSPTHVRVCFVSRCVHTAYIR